MAKRRSEEARVLAYFTQAPLEKAELMLGLVRDQVKQRGAHQPGSTSEVQRVKRKVRKAKAAGASVQTSFDPAVVAQ